MNGIRKKEIVLIILSVLFMLGYFFYVKAIAPAIGDRAKSSIERKIRRVEKNFQEDLAKETRLKDELKSSQSLIQKNQEVIAQMKEEAEKFKKKILSDKYEIELFQFLFGRDARYNVIGLGNSQRRYPKGNYTEIVYNYKVKGMFPDMVKLIQKVENTSNSLSISSVTISQPKAGKDEEQEDGVEAELEIHVILSADPNALSFEEFMMDSPEISLKKIEGNPWDVNFGSGAKTAEGPTGAIKRLWLKSVFYLYDQNKRAIRFEDKPGWYREGDEFDIEEGRSSTRAKVVAIGGRYVIIRHLNKNLTFKLTLNASDDLETDEDRNYKELIDFKL
jgi:hypothetical protein